MLTGMIIEDSPSDMHKAVTVLGRLGIEEPILFPRVDLAVVYLQDIVDGARRAPDLLILDLDLGSESGFEILRFCRANQALQSMRIVAWTGMGELQKELCRLFGIQVVSKSAGVGEFERIVKAAAA